MTRSVIDPSGKGDRFRVRRVRLPAAQVAIEHQAMRLRGELGISEFIELPLEIAVRCVPNCEVLGLRHVPGVTLDQVIHARTKGAALTAENYWTGVT